MFVVISPNSLKIQTHHDDINKHTSYSRSALNNFEIMVKLTIRLDISLNKLMSIMQ